MLLRTSSGLVENVPFHLDLISVEHYDTVSENVFCEYIDRDCICSPDIGMIRLSCIPHLGSLGSNFLEESKENEAPEIEEQQSTYSL